MRRFSRWAAVLCVSCAAAAHANWPERRITIVSSASPGASQDVVARAVATGLSEALHQPVVVENKPGAATIISALALARAKPDGYTFGTMGNSTLTANIYMVKDLPYDAERDFTPITLIIHSAPVLMMVRGDSKVSSLADLFAVAKAHPGKLSYSVAGNLAPIMGDILTKTAGVDMRQVRYKESNTGVLDIVTGRVDSGYLGLSLAIPFLADGRLRPVTIISRERAPNMPQLPALEEFYPGIAVDGWFALSGPANLPPEIGNRVRAVLTPYLKRPEVQNRFLTVGLFSKGVTSQEETRAFIRSERERWGRIARELDIKPQ